MQLNLNRPICFFDLETTGVSITLDKIVEISILKVFPGGNDKKKTWLVNPEIPMDVLIIVFAATAPATPSKIINKPAK